MNLYPQTALIIAEKRTALDTNALKTLVLIGGNLGVERSIFNIGAQNAADFKFLADLRIDGGFICQHKFQTLHTAGAYVRDDDIMVGKPRHVPELLVVGSADAKALAEKLVGRAGQILRVGIRATVALMAVRSVSGREASSAARVSEVEPQAVRSRQSMQSKIGRDFFTIIFLSVVQGWRR